MGSGTVREGLCIACCKKGGEEVALGAGVTVGVEAGIKGVDMVGLLGNGGNSRGGGEI